MKRLRTSSNKGAPARRAGSTASRDELRAWRRRYWLDYGPRLRARRYGIPVEELRAMEKRQGGACAICRKPSQVALSIDHCHSTGRVRGLLCYKCNFGIGSYGDDPTLVRAAIAYLEPNGSDA